MVNKRILLILALITSNMLCNAIKEDNILQLEEQVADWAIQRQIIARDYKARYEPSKHKLLPLYNHVDYENVLIDKHQVYILKQSLLANKQELNNVTQYDLLHTLSTFEEKILASKKSLLQAYLDHHQSAAKNVFKYGGVAMLLGTACLYAVYLYMGPYTVIPAYYMITGKQPIVLIKAKKIPNNVPIACLQGITGFTVVSSMIYLFTQKKPLSELEFSIAASEVHCKTLQEKLCKLNHDTKEHDGQ